MKVTQEDFDLFHGIPSKEYQKLIHLAQKAERCTTREKAQKILLKVKKARKKLQKRAESHDE